MIIINDIFTTSWFRLDGVNLRYYRSDTASDSSSSSSLLGSIHLASVNAVLPSRVSDAPMHALDLVCADRIYTVAGQSREDMVRWATVLSLVLQGQYRYFHPPRSSSSSSMSSFSPSSGIISRSGSSVLKKGSSSSSSSSSVLKKVQDLLPSSSSSSSSSQPSPTRRHRRSSSTGTYRRWKSSSSADITPQQQLRLSSTLIASSKSSANNFVHQPLLTTTEEEEDLDLLMMTPELFTVTFEQQEGRLGLEFESTIDDHVIVKGFDNTTTTINRGDRLISIQDQSCDGISFTDVITHLREAAAAALDHHHHRPLKLGFLRWNHNHNVKNNSADDDDDDDDTNPNHHPNLTEGWVLAKSNTDSTLRIRLLQIRTTNDKHELWCVKPSALLKESRQRQRKQQLEEPRHVMMKFNLAELRDIRPSRDTSRRGVEQQIQGLSREWGICLSSRCQIFHFYTRSHVEQLEWIDAIVVVASSSSSLGTTRRRILGKEERNMSSSHLKSAASSSSISAVVAGKAGKHPSPRATIDANDHDDHHHQLKSKCYVHALRVISDSTTSSSRSSSSNSNSSSVLSHHLDTDINDIIEQPLSDRVMKRSALSHEFLARRLTLYSREDKVYIYPDDQEEPQFKTRYIRPLGIIRLKNIISIRPFHEKKKKNVKKTNDQQKNIYLKRESEEDSSSHPSTEECSSTTTHEWRLDIIMSIVVSHHQQQQQQATKSSSKVRRLTTLGFRTKIKLMDWARALERKVKELTGRSCTTVTSLEGHDDDDQSAVNHHLINPEHFGMILSISKESCCGFSLVKPTPRDDDGAAAGAAAGGAAAGGSESSESTDDIPVQEQQLMVVAPPPITMSSINQRSSMQSRGWLYVENIHHHHHHHAQTTGPVVESSSNNKYHLRYVILEGRYVYCYKYQLNEDRVKHICAGRMDLSEIQDVRSVDVMVDVDALEFGIELISCRSTKRRIVALNDEQKQTWMTNLIWASDYYYNSRGDPASSDTTTSTTYPSLKNQPREFCLADHRHLNKSNGNASTSMHQHVFNNMCTIHGWLIMETPKRTTHRVYGILCDQVLSMYENQSKVMEECGDAIDAISLAHVSSIVSMPSDTDDQQQQRDGFQLTLSRIDNDLESVVLSFRIPIMDIDDDDDDDDDDTHAREEEESSSSSSWKWILAMCNSNTKLVLRPLEKVCWTNPTNNLEIMSRPWTSTRPKDGWIWKLDALYQVYRRRFFTLQNHELIYYDAPPRRTSDDDYLTRDDDAREIGKIQLCELHELTKFSSRQEAETNLTTTAAEHHQKMPCFRLEIQSHVMSSSSNQLALVLAFYTEQEMEDWCDEINVMFHLNAHIRQHLMMKHHDTEVLPQLSTRPIEILPNALMKDASFFPSPEDSTKVLHSSTDVPRRLTFPMQEREFHDPHEPREAAHGWLYYQFFHQDQEQERFRFRYFVLSGSQLRLYKHNVSLEEAMMSTSAICYRVFDCQRLLEMETKFSILGPENALRLIFSTTAGSSRHEEQRSGGGGGGASSSSSSSSSSLSTPEPNVLVLVPATDEEEAMWKSRFNDLLKALAAGRTNLRTRCCHPTTTHNGLGRRTEEEVLATDVRQAVRRSGILYQLLSIVDDREDPPEDLDLDLDHHHQSSSSSWESRYFVTTASRCLIFATALDLYDEDADVLLSFESRAIASVEMDLTDDRTFTIGLASDHHSSSAVTLRADSPELRLQWMKLLCEMHGQLDISSTYPKQEEEEH